MNKVVLIVFIAVLFFIVYFFLMMGNPSNIIYVRTMEKAKEENVFIKKYKIIDSLGRNKSLAWLEYGYSKNIITGHKTIDKKRKVLFFQSDKNKSLIYLEAFYKKKKLSVVDKRGVVGIIGVDESMDTIILKPNKEESFYIIAEN